MINALIAIDSLTKPEDRIIMLNKVIGDLNGRIAELEAENKKMKEMKCPPISEGDTCICPIEELETKLEQHRWIPVSKEMPSQVSGHWGSEIVFATDGKQAWACKYNFSAEYWTAPSGDITHWKPIILP